MRNIFFKNILLCFCSLFFISLYAEERIPMTLEKSGIYTIPCEVNGLRMKFVFDTGASTVSISLTEAMFMLKNGYLEDSDFIGTTNTRVANGEIQENAKILLKEVKVGNNIINNVEALVSKSLDAPLLLGQSVIRKLGIWKIEGNYLVLNNTRENYDYIQNIISSGSADEIFKYANELLNDNDINQAILLFNKAADLYVETEDWYNFYKCAKKSADLKDAEGMHKLSFCYAYGYGTKKDTKRAFLLSKESAEHGYVRAQRNLGICYEEGIGTKKNLSQAVYWYKISAEQGDSVAQNNLAVCYIYGNGVNKNTELALYWFNKAAENGNPLAMLSLGILYEDGDGVEPDILKAKYWYERAAEYENEEAESNLKRIENERASDIALRTLYETLKKDNYDVPNDFSTFEQSLKNDVNAQRALYEQLKRDNYDVPDDYDSYERTLFPDNYHANQNMNNADMQYNNISYYIAQTSTLVNLREKPEPKSKVIIKIPKGSMVLLSSSDKDKTFRKVLYIDENIFGYVNKNYLSNIKKIEEDESGSLQIEGKNYKNTADIKIENRTNKNITINIGKNSYSFKPFETRTLTDIKPGKYKTMASSPGTIPFVAVDNVEAGYIYSWVFIISKVKR